MGFVKLSVDNSSAFLCKFWFNFLHKFYDKTKVNITLVVNQKKAITIQNQSKCKYCLGDTPVWDLKKRAKLLGV